MNGPNDIDLVCICGHRLPDHAANGACQADGCDCLGFEEDADEDDVP